MAEVEMGADGVVNCSVADLTGAVGNEGANAFTLVELMQSMALRRTRISFIILGGRIVVACWLLCGSGIGFCRLASSVYLRKLK